MLERRSFLLLAQYNHDANRKPAGRMAPGAGAAVRGDSDGSLTGSGFCAECSAAVSRGSLLLFCAGCLPLQI